MTVLVPIRRSFPRNNVVVIPRRKGVGGILSVLTSGGSLNEASSANSGQPWYVPDALYNWQGKASPDQVLAATQQANVGTTQASINPLTGQPVQAAVNYANSTSGDVALALQQAQAVPTGSPIADSFSSLLSSVVGTGTDTGTNTSGTPTWEIALFVLAAGAGAYLIYKAVK